MIRVSELKVGLVGQIVEINAEALLRNRLLEMGFIPGSSVVVKRKMPLGGPIVVQSGSIFVALRSDEAEKIWVDHD